MEIAQYHNFTFQYKCFTLYWSLHVCFETAAPAQTLPLLDTVVYCDEFQ